MRGEEYVGGGKKQYSGFDNSSYNKNKYDLEADKNKNRLCFLITFKMPR